MSNKTVIKLENLSKMYKLGVISHGTLFRDIQSWWALKRGKEDPHARIGTEYNEGDFWALKDLNAEIKAGDRVGIIGKNGAGKSTLLKILSRITTPTTGSAKIRGKVSSLLEVGTGFHGELTGRENIYLNGAILGMKKREVDKKLDEIIAFSGIERHIDTPVKRYSSGMYVRLGFAVAAHLDSDILIADEVLAVGDAEFQKKALGKMSALSTSEGRTILFVSHNMTAVRSLCNNGILLEKGRIKFTGDITDTIENYMSDKYKDIKLLYDFRYYERGLYDLFPLGSKIFIEQVEFIKTPNKVYKTGEKLLLRVNFVSYEDLSVYIAVSIKNQYGEPVCLIESEKLECKVDVSYSKVLSVDTSYLVPGSYHLYIEPYSWGSNGRFIEYDETSKMHFEIIADSTNNRWESQYWGDVRLPKSVFLN